MRHEIGVVTKLSKTPEGTIARVREMGFTVCHLSVYDPGSYTDSVRDLILRECAEHGVRIAALWAGYPGHVVWDLIEGPVTTGLVPPALREERVGLMKRAADFAAAIGVGEVVTHLGFVPEDLNDPLYTSLIPVLQDIADHCRGNGQDFCFETGQETPVTLLRTIEDVGRDNVGVNFDPANLILYGKGNPVDALPLLGPWIRSVHAKDGLYPRDGRTVGEEKPVGDGQVDFLRFLAALAATGYDRPICIECDLPEAVRPDAVARGRERLAAWLA